MGLIGYDSLYQNEIFEKTRYRVILNLLELLNWVFFLFVLWHHLVSDILKHPTNDLSYPVN